MTAKHPSVLVITAQKPDSTGSGVYVAQTIEGMLDAGCAVSLVCGIDASDTPVLPQGTQLFPVRFGTPELPFKVCGMSDEMPYPATRYRDMTPVMVAQFKAAFSQAIRDACTQGPWPEVVVCHHLYLVTALAVGVVGDLARELGRACPSLRAVCHSTCLRQMGKHGLERDFVIAGIRRLETIFALHAEQKREIVTLYGVSESRVRVVGSGFDARVFNRNGRAEARTAFDAREREAGFEPASKRVCYVGKIWSKKGVVSLIKAAQLLRLEPGDLEFRLVGGHNSEEEFAAIVALAESSPFRMVFAGKVSQEELVQSYQASDVFVLPSFFEGLPLVSIEALACGCKVVMTDLPGIRPWIVEHIPQAPVHFVAPPRMQSVDEPVPDDLPAFEQRLARTLEESLAAPAPKQAELTGLEGLTWGSLARKLVG